MYRRYEFGHQVATFKNVLNKCHLHSFLLFPNKIFDIFQHQNRLNRMLKPAKQTKTSCKTTPISTAEGYKANEPKHAHKYTSKHKNQHKNTQK